VVQLQRCRISQYHSEISGSMFFQPSYMPHKLPPKFRKFNFGFEKLKNRKRVDELINYQTLALDKFIIKESQILIDDNVNVGNGILENVVTTEKCDRD
jgi:hypothetical protein